MIENERQLEVTRAQVRAFERALSESRTVPPGVHPLIFDLETGAIEAQLADLRAEVADYERRRAQCVVSGHLGETCTRCGATSAAKWPNGDE